MIDSGSHRPVRDPLGVAIAFVTYVALGWAGLQIPTLADVVTLFWPPTGVAVAAFARYGRPGLLVPALGSVVLNAYGSSDALFTITASASNTFETFVIWKVYEALTSGRTQLHRPMSALWFFVASLVGTTIGGLVGALAASSLLDTDVPYLTLAGHWFAGDAAGAVLVAPVLLTTSRSEHSEVERWDGTATLAVLTVLGVLGLFCLRLPGDAAFSPLGLTVLVPVVACAVRFGARGGHVAAAAVALASYVGTIIGRGPFVSTDPESTLAFLYANVVLTGTTALFLGAIVEQRDRALRDLLVSDERLRAIFEYAADGILLLDRGRRIVLANPAAIRMSGRTFEGDSWRLLEGDSTAALRDALKRGVAEGQREVEAHMRHAPDGGEEREFLVRATLLGTRRRFEGAVVLVQDVTEREREQREKAMLEQHLASAQRLESIGNLAGGIAHDFNNMLQAIQANLELAEMSTAKGQSPVPSITRALDAASRATALTRQLLAFSRRQPASFHVVDVVAVVRSSLALLERLLPEDLHLVFAPRADSACVRGDATQVEQVLMNLVVNARDAMPNGGELRVEIETQRIEGTDSGVVRLIVTDAGPGVDSSIRDRIFEPFFTTKEGGRGTGLGLAVVYGIVKSHGGSVCVEAAVPKGARFVVELPWMHDQAQATEAETTDEAPIGRGERILLVEDDVHVRTAVRDSLLSSGFEVQTASTGRDAVDVFRDADGAFDVVLLDVVMPVMGGREAYEHLRKLDPGVAVIFTTGYSEEQIDVGFVLRERVPVLTKPYARGALIQAILEVASSKPIGASRDADESFSRSENDSGCD